MFTLLAEGNPSVEEMEKLIQEGVDVNAKDEKGLTPLLRLAKSEKISDNLVKIFSLLIQHGANVHSLDSNGKNALLFWCKNRKQHRNKNFWQSSISLLKIGSISIAKTKTKIMFSLYCADLIKTII
jgi:ankyrin repeat protein